MSELCDGGDITSMQDNFCMVQMSYFWFAPFDYSLNDLVKAKVIAVNERGESAVSDSNLVGSLL